MLGYIGYWQQNIGIPQYCQRSRSFRDYTELDLRLLYNLSLVLQKHVTSTNYWNTMQY